MLESLFMGYLRKGLKLVKKIEQHRTRLLPPIHCQKNRRTRSTKGLTKRYRVIFTCLTTRAIHIKLAGDLSTDSFLSALRSFNSRKV